MRPLDLRVVLVRPLYEGNIGSAARALNNMGGQRLILVAPRCRVDEEARKFASSAQQTLAERIEYSDWDGFFAAEPAGVSFAFTSRDGTDRRVRAFTELLSAWPAEHPAFAMATEAPLTVHLVFGPEEDGLSADDLKRLQAAVHLPVYGENPSLNLAQAVLLAMFLVQDRWNGVQRPPRDEQTVRKAAAQEFPEHSVRQWLEESGFEINDEQRLNALTILRRLILRAAPTSKELRIFEGIVQRSLQKMRKPLNNLWKP